MAKLVSESELMSGAFVFGLMDSVGLPLEMITEILREKGMGFNVYQFVKAAKASKNYSSKKSPQRLQTKLEQALSTRLPEEERAEAIKKIAEVIAAVYGNENLENSAGKEPLPGDSTPGRGQDHSVSGSARRSDDLLLGETGSTKDDGADDPGQDRG